MAGLPLPATTFHVLKGGLDPHAPAILLDTFAPGRLIRNEEPGLFLTFFPHRTQLRLVLMFLPQMHGAKPRLAWRTHHLRTGAPVVKVPVALALAVLVLLDAQHVVPAVGLAQLNEFETTQAAIGDDG